MRISFVDTSKEIETTKEHPPLESKLTAKATIDWYREPYTTYRVETQITAIDLETGQEVSIGGVSESGDGSDAADLETTQLLQDANKEFFGTINTGSGVAKEVTEFVVEMVMPDQWDIIIPVAGAVGKRVFKVGRGAKKFGEFVIKLNERLAARSDVLLKAGRKALGVVDDHAVVIKTETRLVRVTRSGKLLPNAERQAANMGVVERKTCWFGEFCFVAGTPIVMNDGSLKTIEQVKEGDFVLSKNESTGEVASKKVTRTFVRQAPATLVLAFSNGEKIETTAEHPFFVEHKGAVPAGLLAVGNSIVTRAGPALAIGAIEKKNTSQTVFNFSVEDSHTYFVGNSALWVHNYDGLRPLGNGVWESPAGLRFGNMPPNSPHGHRIYHVWEHWKLRPPTPGHPVHSVFNSVEEMVKLLDDAWTKKVGPGTPQTNGNTFWDVHMGGRIIGTNGEQSVRIVVRNGTSDIITAFPV